MNIKGTSAAQPDPIANATLAAASSQKSSQSRQSSTAGIPADTVHISSASRAALQEIAETKVQTITEAQSGDAQARRLLAREAAAEKTGA